VITVWKYTLELTRTQTIPIPFNYTPRCVLLTQGEVTLYCEVDTSYHTVPRKVLIVGTGLEIGDTFDAFSYVGSCEQFIGYGSEYKGPDSRFVWHVYMERNRK
jgi:hypothetical protein